MVSSESLTGPLKMRIARVFIRTYPARTRRCTSLSSKARVLGAGKPPLARWCEVVDKRKPSNDEVVGFLVDSLLD